MFKRVRAMRNKLQEWASEGDLQSEARPQTVAPPETGSQVEANSEPEVQLCYNNITSTSPYTYTRLPAAINKPIRLLTLLPGPGNTDIQCRLTTVDLDAVVTEDNEGFEALSYVWGDTEDKTAIQIDNATIYVTRNLRSALLHLRKTDQPRTLWVDAVCIHQKDTDECNSQLRLMGDIYTRASCTVVWLGCHCCLLGTAEPDLSSYKRENLKEQMDKVKNLFLVINLLGQEAATVAEEGRQIIPKKGDEYEEGTTYDLIRKVNPDWKPIFQNSWWTRVWTFQEIVLAQDAMLCMGNEEVKWTFFGNAIAYYKALGFDTFSEAFFGHKVKAGLEPLTMVNSMKTARESLALGNVGDELLFYLASSRGRDCTEAHDRIYGVLGLLRADCDVGIGVDYRSDPADVYRRATKVLLQQSGNLDVLGFCFPFKFPRVSNLPSWVPDWGSTGNLALPLMNDAKGKLRTTHAAKGVRSNPRWEDDDKALILQGHIVDTITKLGGVQAAVQMDDRNEGSMDHMLNDPAVLAAAESFPATWDDLDPERPYRHLFSEYWKGIKLSVPLLKAAVSELTSIVTNKERYIEWQDLVTTELKKTGLSDLEIDVIFRDTLTTSTPYPSGPAETQARFVEWAKALSSIRSLKGVKLDRISPTMFKSLGFIAGIWKTMDEDNSSFSTYTTHTTRRRAGITRLNRVCLLPKRTEAGDEIAVLRGGRVPVVLRPREDGSMEFIGEAYVHGIMDGECFDEMKCVDFKIT